MTFPATERTAAPLVRVAVPSTVLVVVSVKVNVPVGATPPEATSSVAMEALRMTVAPVVMSAVEVVRVRVSVAGPITMVNGVPVEAWKVESPL